jgi:hypothetical protein
MGQETFKRSIPDIDELISPKKQKFEVIDEETESEAKEDNLIPPAIDNTRTRLFLGGGDLSYELAFAKKHPEWSKQMVVTTYDCEDTMNQKYPSAKNNKEALQKNGVIVLHKIDATQLHESNVIKKMKLEHIYFSHPHVGTRGKYTTQNLIKDFFSSAAAVQLTGQKIHLPRLKSNYKGKGAKNKTKNARKIYGLYKHENLKDTIRLHYRVIDKHQFSGGKVVRYPGYTHKETQKDNSAKSTHHGSTEYIFIKEDDEIMYNSDDIKTDNESDAE